MNKLYNKLPDTLSAECLDSTEEINESVDNSYSAPKVKVGDKYNEFCDEYYNDDFVED